MNGVINWLTYKRTKSQGETWGFYSLFATVTQWENDVERQEGTH